MKPKVYIDGQEGTTGLQIHDRLAGREDIEVLCIDGARRRDGAERKRLMDAADLVFLCLPDDAAREAVAMLGARTRVIDASTAHRTADGWVYGFPELSGERRAAIRGARLVANPGCHATGFLAIVYPLARLGLVPPDCAGLTCFSLTGYSGGGKAMIARYETERTPELGAPGLYALSQSHKHLPEMMGVAGLTRRPAFCPVIGDYYAGMAVTVTFPGAVLGGLRPEILREAYENWYDGERFIETDAALGSGTLYANQNVGTNRLTLTVSGDAEVKTVTARFDNLGKGASGAAVQNMNLMLGLEETAGLE